MAQKITPAVSPVPVEVQKRLISIPEVKNRISKYLAQSTEIGLNAFHVQFLVTHSMVFVPSGPEKNLQEVLEFDPEVTRRLHQCVVRVQDSNRTASFQLLGVTLPQCGSIGKLSVWFGISHAKEPEKFEREKRKPKYDPAMTDNWDRFLHKKRGRAF